MRWSSGRSAHVRLRHIGVLVEDNIGATEAGFGGSCDRRGRRQTLPFPLRNRGGPQWFFWRWPLIRNIRRRRGSFALRGFGGGGIWRSRSFWRERLLLLLLFVLFTVCQCVLLL